MEKFKMQYVDPDNFEESTIETNIPEDIAVAFQKALNTISVPNFTVTPMMCDKNKNIIAGILEDGDSRHARKAETGLKYKLTIEKFEGDE